MQMDTARVRAGVNRTIVRCVTSLTPWHSQSAICMVGASERAWHGREEITAP
jgi:hypothetical protein